MSNNKHIIGFALKWCFDRLTALVGLVVLSPVLLVIAIVIRCESKGPALFWQERVGQNGRIFKICKFRTMRNAAAGDSITVLGDERITKSGRWIRKYKIDCLTELYNVLIEQMSIVGPRPDVPGYADKLQGDDRAILQLKPGITGPASLKYRNEESLLAQQDDPKHYNDCVIWPDKVKINLQYLRDWSLCNDIKVIIRTIFG